jgi:hypothetical protein
MRPSYSTIYLVLLCYSTIINLFVSDLLLLFTDVLYVYIQLLTFLYCEISSSHCGEYDVQSCLLGCTAV